MDFAIHACVGGLIGRALAPPRDPTDPGTPPADPTDPGTPPAGPAEPNDAAAPGGATDVSRWTRLGALIALLPDADHVLELVSAEAYLVHHRTFSHSIAAGVVTTVAGALLSKRDGRRVAAVVAASYASHLLLDVLTPFGTGLWWPVSDAMPALDGLWIVAPWLGLLCVVTALLGTWKGRASRQAGRRAAIASLVAVGAFLLVELGVAGRAASAVPGHVVLAGPSWTQPLAGLAFAVEADRLTGYRVPLSGPPEPIAQPARTKTVPSDADVEAAREAALPYVRRLRVPVAYRPPGADRVVIFEDAQFWPIGPERIPFEVRVDLEAGTVAVTEQGRPGQVVLYLIAVVVSVLLTRRSPPASAPQGGLPPA